MKSGEKSKTGRGVYFRQAEKERRNIAEPEREEGKTKREKELKATMP